MTLNSLIVFPFLITFILAFPDFFVMISHRLFAGLNPPVSEFNLFTVGL